MAKVKQGTEQTHGAGYGGSGFKFNEGKSTKKLKLRQVNMDMRRNHIQILMRKKYLKTGITA